MVQPGGSEWGKAGGLRVVTFSPNRAATRRLGLMLGDRPRDETALDTDADSQAGSAWDPVLAPVLVPLIPLVAALGLGS